MEFKLKLPDVTNYLSKSIDEVYRDVLDYILDNVSYSCSSKGRFIRSKIFNQGVSCIRFRYLLQYIVLSVLKLDFTIDTSDTLLSADYKFEDIFECSYGDFYNSILNIISKSLDGDFNKSDEDLKMVFNCFLDAISSDLGFFRCLDIVNNLSEIDISETNFRNLLPDDMKQDFDDKLARLQRVHANDFNFADKMCRLLLFDSLDKSCSGIDWVEIYNKYEESLNN